MRRFKQSEHDLAASVPEMSKSRGALIYLAVWLSGSGGSLQRSRGWFDSIRRLCLGAVAQFGKSTRFLNEVSEVRILPASFP